MSFSDCDRLGDLGVALVATGLRRVFKAVNETPKEINAQMNDADLVVDGFHPLLVPRVKYEVKTEWKHTGNFFWETFSDKTKGRLGWGVTTTADTLYYLFWSDAIGYRIDDLQRKVWLFDYHKSRYEERKQGKYQQKNETWGCLIPVDVDWLEAQRFSFASAKPYIEARVHQTVAGAA